MSLGSLGEAVLDLVVNKNPLKEGIEGAGKEAEGALGAIGGVLKTAIPVAAITAGVVGVGKALLDAGKAAADEQVGIAQMATAVKNTGADWDTASAAIEEYLAMQTQRAALDDGEGREAISRLTSATGDYQKAMDLLPVAMDLAAAKGIDLQTATELVGKVANGNVGVLKRYGITLDEGADATEALAAMQQKFGGQAEAYGNTQAGAQQKLDIAMGNLKETIGGAVLPVMTQVMTLFADLATRAMPLIEQGIAVLVPVIQQAMAWIGENVLPVVMRIVDWIVANWPLIQSTIETVMNAIWSVIQQVWSVVDAIWSQYGDQIMAMASEVFSLVSEIVSTVMSLVGEIISTTWALIDSIWSQYGDQIMTAVRVVFDYIKNTIQNVMTIVRGIINTITALIRGDWEGAWNGIRQIIDGVLAQIRNIVESTLNLILSLFGTNLAQLREDIQAKWNEILTNTQAWLESVLQAIRDFIEPILAAVIKPFKDAWEFLFGHSLMPEMFAAFAQWLVDLLAKIESYIASLFDAVKAPFVQAWDFLFGGDGLIPRFLNKVGEWLQGVKDKLESYIDTIKDAIAAPFEAGKGAVDAVWSELTSGAGEGLERVKNKILEMVEATKEAMVRPYTLAKEAIGRIWDALRGQDEEGRNFLKLPHLKITWVESIIPGVNVPKFDIEWYAQGLDAIFNSPTLIGVGEAGPERVTVSPLGRGGSGGGTTWNLTVHQHRLDDERSLKDMITMLQIAGA